MKSTISKFLAGAALVASFGLSSCVNDLDQLPMDPRSETANKFAADPEKYLGEVMAKCYSCLAISGQQGPNGEPDIKGIDGGTFQWSRAVYILEEFPADLTIWMYDDGGVDEMRMGTWTNTNGAVYGTYSRLYTHVAICNDFLRLAKNPGEYGISYTEDLQKKVDQLCREARALRGLSYYYIIDFFGDAALAWDDMKYGEVPQQSTRKALFDKVVADLEDCLVGFEDSNIYGRVGKDGVEALLCKYYLNAEVLTGTAMYDKCWAHADNIIKRHQGGGFQGSGLANDYLSLFCADNQMFAPGGSLKAQNEILWQIPQNKDYTQPYGGSTFLINGFILNNSTADLDILTGSAAVSDGYMNPLWYGTNDSWGCMHARPQLSNLFSFQNGYSADNRAYLWLTEDAGFNKENTTIRTFYDGYACPKFTAVSCNADGSMPKFVDPVTGLNRAGVTEAAQMEGEKDGITYNWTNYNVPVISQFHNTSVPIYRLADVYLMAAECALRNASGSNMTDALKYVNYVRQRAGVPAWNSSELTLNTLLDERARELYAEMTRRTDLIRFGKWTGSNYLWSWKGGVLNGTSFPAHYNLYPIPANVIAVYGSSYKQNPGY